jgi:hypothetical protein
LDTLVLPSSIHLHNVLCLPLISLMSWNCVLNFMSSDDIYHICIPSRDKAHGNWWTIVSEEIPKMVHVPLEPMLQVLHYKNENLDLCPLILRGMYFQWAISFRISHQCHAFYL